MIGTPVPSPVLDKLSAAAAAAGDAYRNAFKSFAAENPGLADRYVADRLSRTAKGQKLLERMESTHAAAEAARQLGHSITFAGRTWPMQDLSQAGRDAVYRAAAKHGHNPERWPAEVRAKLEQLLASDAGKRPATFGEAAEQRIKTLTRSVMAIDEALEQHGLDPSGWPDDLLDKIATSRLRVDAFEQLVVRAHRLDPEWSTRLVGSNATVGDRGRAERERRQLQADISHQQNSLLAEIQGLTLALNHARGVHERLANFASAGHQMAPESLALQLNEIDELGKKIDAAQKRFASWQATPDEKKSEVYDQLTRKPAHED